MPTIETGREQEDRMLQIELDGICEEILNDPAISRPQKLKGNEIGPVLTDEEVLEATFKTVADEIAERVKESYGIK